MLSWNQWKMSRQIIRTHATTKPIMSNLFLSTVLSIQFSNVSLKCWILFFNQVLKLAMYHSKLHFHFNTAKWSHLRNFKAPWVHTGLIQKYLESTDLVPSWPLHAIKESQVPGIFRSLALLFTWQAKEECQFSLISRPQFQKLPILDEYKFYTNYFLPHLVQSLIP